MQLHSLSLIRRNTSIDQLYDTVIQSVQRNIELLLVGATDVRRNLNTYVFYPYEIGHFISYVYPEKSEDDGMAFPHTNISNFNEIVLLLQILSRLKNADKIIPI